MRGASPIPSMRVHGLNGNKFALLYCYSVTVLIVAYCYKFSLETFLYILLKAIENGVQNIEGQLPLVNVHL
jgi:hypothetical protein